MRAYNLFDDATICALATTPGTSAIAVIRVSGKDAISIVKGLFNPKKEGFDINTASSHSAHYGNIIDVNGMPLDDVIVNIYRTPSSYTGENSVEIFCHGSLYIQQRLLECLVDKGCRLAHPGEFTFRAFVNRKLDLLQAEAVADLIAANSKAAHDIALSQLKGGFSKKIENLRQQLLEFTSLIELELDFSEEDVEFADREKLLELIHNIRKEIKTLLESFSLGNVMKKGIPVAIVGKPNVGKSTLLNALLNEERAIVSAIPGTTRDAIEDVLIINGVAFRFIDTAGLRTSDDEIENMGIEKTIEKIKQALVVLYVFDISQATSEEIFENIENIEKVSEGSSKKIILIGNKSDQLSETPRSFKKLVEKETIFISAKRKENIGLIINSLTKIYEASQIESMDAVVSNVRHYEALSKADHIINDIIYSLKNNISHELLAADMRRALYYLSEITGVQINNDQILNQIFSNFCIGK